MSLRGAKRRSPAKGGTSFFFCQGRIRLWQTLARNDNVKLFIAFAIINKIAQIKIIMHFAKRKNKSEANNI